MKHKRKPHLGGIHEFGTAPYVKDLKAGKLDAHTQIGQLIGYDSESKGYRIYWPSKWSIMVECNVVFNDSDVTTDTTTIISGDLSAGEKDKIIQVPIDMTAVPIWSEQPHYKHHSIRLKCEVRVTCLLQ